MTFDAEFKRALQLLPDAEKDKLILRLLRRDVKLADKLRFELLDTDSVQNIREQLAGKIINRLQVVSVRYYSPGIFLMTLRDISGEINQHVYISKDKAGEIILNCLMLRQALELNNERIASESFGKAYTLCIYIVARIFKIFMLIQKQHEDLHIEFSEDIQAIGNLMGKNHNLMKTAIQNSLDVNWLIEFNIPENITSIYKNLRENGFLK